MTLNSYNPLTDMMCGKYLDHNIVVTIVEADQARPIRFRITIKSGVLVDLQLTIDEAMSILTAIEEGVWLSENER